MPYCAHSQMHQKVTSLCLLSSKCGDDSVSFASGSGSSSSEAEDTPPGVQKKKRRKKKKAVSLAEKVAMLEKTTEGLEKTTETLEKTTEGLEKTTKDIKCESNRMDEDIRDLQDKIKTRDEADGDLKSRQV